MTVSYTPPATNNSSALTKNRIIAPIMLGITIFLGIFIVRPQYLSYIEKKATINSKELELSKLSSEYEALLAIKNTPPAGNTALQVQKISTKFDRAEIMSTIMLNEYTKETLDTNARINISSVSIGSPTILPNGLSPANVNVALQGRTVDEIIDYITYLTTETPYAYTLEDISLPIDTNPEGDIPSGYSMGLSLGIYSYEK